VLVTGGAGYVGSHAVRELLEAGHQVTILDDLSEGHREAVAKDARLVEGDLGDPAALARALEGAEAVLHFAALAYVGASVKDPASYYRGQRGQGPGAAVGDARARRAAPDLQLDLRDVRQPAVPAARREPPDAADQPRTVRPSAPSSARCRTIAAAGGLRAIALRYFNAAGCHEQGGLGEDHDPETHLIPLAIDAALGRGPSLTVFGTDYDTPDGTCIRDYVHVQDLARAHVQALAALPQGDAFRIFNLGTETGSSVREVVGCGGAAVGRPVSLVTGPRRAGDPPRLWPRPRARARSWASCPRFSALGAIVETAYRWRREHPKGYRSAA
jgi:UDP-glucose 4-epimerase